ncbi:MULTISPECIES: DUF3237 domain-containing protein [Clostridium]|uniref:DUF3237 domain-containing protein n=1 Tax=Clostridium TaxID=1485 RepID=UPI0018975EFD|nr:MULTISPECIES: DUF3237 domain-containing protein [Clostridium]MCR1951237.1 DUF3237 domain-containing protein [Clostridium sp. DSM 100503]MDI9218415.1 DUF3237 domain-containing protein [Clostridium tertium]
MFLEADLAMELEVEITNSMTVGNGLNGYLNIIPITGGTFKCLNNDGVFVMGKVLPGGADWNTRKSETLSHAFAKYTIETEDNIFISVENEGYLDDMARGKIIKTVPKFKVDENSNYSYLNTGVFVASLDVNFFEKSIVSIKVYKLR